MDSDPERENEKEETTDTREPESESMREPSPSPRRHEEGPETVELDMEPYVPPPRPQQSTEVDVNAQNKLSSRSGKVTSTGDYKKQQLRNSYRSFMASQEFGRESVSDSTNKQRTQPPALEAKPSRIAVLLEESHADATRSSSSRGHGKKSVTRKVAQRQMSHENVENMFCSKIEQIMFRSMYDVRLVDGYGGEHKGESDDDREPMLTSSKSVMSTYTRSSNNTTSTRRSGTVSSRLYPGSGGKSNGNAYSSRRSSGALGAQSKSGKVYASQDDATNCTFAPKIKKNMNLESHQQEGEEMDAKSQAAALNKMNAAFLERQEAEEKRRRSSLDANQGKAQYDCIIDKKNCPECGAKQSFDEIKEKRKKCPNCNVEYVNKTSWAKVKGQFFKRDVESRQANKEKREKLVKELDYQKHTVKATSFDRKTGKISTKSKNLVEDNEKFKRDEFFARMKEKEGLRASRLEAAEKKVYDSKCTFAPVIAAKPIKKKKTDSDDEDSEDLSDSEKDAIKSFLNRMQNDLSSRREAQPIQHKVAATTVKPFSNSKADPRRREADKDTMKRSGRVPGSRNRNAMNSNYDF